MNGNNALEALETGKFKVFYPENNGREGLFINIQALFLWFFGVNEPWALRLPSAIFGILTVLGLYFMAKEVFLAATKNEHSATYAGLLASFFLATSFWHINFSRIGFRAIMAPFFLTWSIYFLLLTLRKKSNLANIFGGMIHGLGFYSYIAYRPTPLIILINGFAQYFKSRQTEHLAMKELTIFFLSAFIVALPLGIYFVNHPEDFFGRTAQISIFSSPNPRHDLGINIIKTAGMFNFVGDWNWRHNFSGRPLLFWPVGILFVAGVIIAIWKIIVKRDYFNAEFFSLVWITITALPVIISNEGVPHALRSILMAPAVFILAASAGLYLFDWIKKHSRLPRYALNAYVALFITLLILEAFSSYAAWATRDEAGGAFSAEYVEIGRRLNDIPRETEKYVIVEAQGVDVRGVPMPAQTVMFITNTFLPEKQKEKNIYYVTDAKDVPNGAYYVTIR
jgi:4-amino-4-deoxy-L-arabinose transferase-like glycosyltransferase